MSEKGSTGIEFLSAANKRGFWDRVWGRRDKTTENVSRPQAPPQRSRVPQPRIERDFAVQVLELDCSETQAFEPQRLVGSLAQPRSGGQFISAAALIQKAKQFDDGLYAAVELAALHGCSARRAKTRWEFLEGELHSKPISFYPWSEELASLFRQM